MRLNQEDTSAFNTHLKSGKFSHSHKVLTTDLIITLKGSIVNAVDPNGADRIVYLPEREAGRFFVVGHIGTANILSVQTAQGVELLQLQKGETALLFAGDPEWIGVSAQMNLKVFGYTGPNHSEGLVPDPGAGPVDPNPDNRRFLSELGWQSIGLLTAGDDYYKNFKGGAVTLAPLGAETLEFTSANSILSILAIVGTQDVIQFTVNQSAIDHNALTNYVADQHVAHSGVTLTAGVGLSGGGNIAASRTFDLDLSDITVGTPVLADTFGFYSISGSATRKATLTTLNGILDHNALLNYSANRHIDHTAVSIVAGTGLTGGGDITTSRTLSLDINGLVVDTIATGDFFPFFDISGGDTNKITFGTLNTSLDHNSLNNYVANQHVDHTSVSISTTEGIQGGGTIAATRTLKLDINGLTAYASPLATDYTVVYDGTAGTHKKVLWSAHQTADGDLTAIAALTGTGIARRTATDTWSVGTAVANSELATMGAYSFKGNNTGSAATPTDVTIQGLTAKATPVAADIMMIADSAASNAWKSVTFTQLGTLFALLASPTFTGTPAAPTAAADTNTTQLATTAFVVGQAGSATPLVDAGTAVVGTSLRYARQDHVHPTDTSRMAVAGNQTTTGGFRVTPYSGGTVSSGTFTPDAYNHNYQYYTNNGAHTLAAPANDCAIDILVTNGASAGAITFSGFTVGSNTGDALTTTNANKFIISIRRINAVATYTIKALQ